MKPIHHISVIVLLVLVSVTGILYLSDINQWAFQSIYLFVFGVGISIGLISLWYLVVFQLLLRHKQSLPMYHTILSLFLIVAILYFLSILIQPWLDQLAESFNPKESMGLIKTIDEPKPTESNDGKSPNQKDLPNNPNQKSNGNRPFQDFQDSMDLYDQISQGKQVIMVAYLPSMHHIRRLILSAYHKEKHFVRQENPFEQDLPYISVDLQWEEKNELFKDFLTKNAYRSKKQQRYYLLDFNPFALFGVNEPILIEPIDNVAPSIFVSTFQTDSFMFFKDTYSLGEATEKDVEERETHETDTTNENSIAAKKDAFYDRTTPDFLEYYTRHTEDKDYLQLAKEIVGDETDPFKKVNKIRSYFEKNFTYTLNPGGEEGADRLKYFLFENKKGYCTYFAFAFTMLARIEGVPTRVVTGFLPNPRRMYYDFYLITGKDLHAWPEVYFEETGWITFDIVPKLPELMQEDLNFSIPQNDIATKNEMDYLKKLVDIILGVSEKIPGIKETRSGANQSWFTHGLQGYVGYLLLILMLTVYLAMLGVKVFRLVRPRFIKHPSLKLIASYLNFLYLLNDCGFGRKKGETHIQFGIRVKEQTQVDFSDLISFYLQAKYKGQIQPNEWKAFRSKWILRKREWYRHIHGIKRVISVFHIRSVITGTRRK